ncbi:hypothetical protein AAG570_001058 [Ranatra chinensis]|uniref:Intraflagellar transport protein 140 homolog n=1 Tax=Ranatra chinensis TaxID=642074 RepID=A0ABD0YAS1_9HEMI
MTLYFDYRVNVGDYNATYNCLQWHSQHPLLAVGAFSQDKGGAVYICDELGERLADVDPLTHPNWEVTILSWHPSRRTLVIGWKGGEMRVWNGDTDYNLVQSTKQAPAIIGVWSQQGGRFVTAHSDGEIAGWRLDARGQLLSLFSAKADSGLPIAIEMRRVGQLDLAGLAKKAVAGDERALDMFSSWRPRTAGRKTHAFQDSLSFFVATDKGSVLFFNDNGDMQEVLTSPGAIRNILHNCKDDHLLIVTEGLYMNYFAINSTGGLQEITKVKLSATSAHCPGVISWVGEGIVACAVGDVTIRFWEPSTGNSYSLVMDNQDIAAPREMITSLAFASHKNMLCACTNIGNITVWRMTGPDQDDWHRVGSSKIKYGIQEAMWGPNLIAINTANTVFILREHTLSAVYNSQVSVMQTSASHLIVSSDGEEAELNTDLQVSGIALGKECVVLWSGKVMAVYQVIPINSINVIGSFACECTAAGVWDQSVIVLTATGKVQVLTLQGTIKQTIETDGQAITLNVNGHYATISTMSGMLQVWDLSRREAKPQSKVKDLMEAIPDFGEVMLAQCNGNGSRVAITIAGSNLTPTPVLYVWTIDTDTINSHAFTCKKSKRFVISVQWDHEEPRLLVCETKRPGNSSNKKITSSGPLNGSKVGSNESDPVSFISTSGHGLLTQDSVPMEDDFISLLAIDTPYYIILKKNISQNVAVGKLLMRDFEGLDDCDSVTKNAVINFSLNLSIGDLDQAFKAIRNIKSVAVWTTLAKMCVKGRRLDVARICLGNMKHTRGVRALIEAEKEPEEEARFAALALQLGMLDEAEKLYKQCGRYDLLNLMYQRGGQWEKAIEISEQKDRIHLRNTFHNYARHLEAQGDTDMAANMYYKAETHRHEVPRMLLYDTPNLEKYVINSKDPNLIKWWAQYMESTGDMDLATKFYQDAGDHLSMVRVMCYLEDFEKAAVIADTTGDKAACYHLARQLENMGRLQEAIHFFTRATAYANAIRMCKEQGLEDQLWALALSAGPREQLEVAKYIENISPDRAILLYHRAGMLHRAVDLAFRNNQYEAVELIATELTSDSDVEILMKCADYFMEQQHYEKAVHLLAIAKQYEDAITTCWDHNVVLNEELAEKLTPDQGHENRVRLLETLGDCALAQANYHLATKKYTQAGNKVKAMKALLKSGDTEKIIFFANVSRQREMYVMAANYLQSLDWQARPELLKTIINFYTKGKTPHLLANFYMACAQVEVDDYGNYEKALGALNEAARCLSKDAEHYSDIIETVTRKTSLVNKFLEVRRLFERGDGDGGMSHCRQLLSVAGELVRRGDVYALMVEHVAKKNDWALAKQLALDLQKAQPYDNLSFYIHKGRNLVV